jgi:hypothetical protein
VYVAWGDLGIEPATGLHRPWVLDGVPRHDGECSEVNPITWYSLAHHALTVRGPSPSGLGIACDMGARIRFVVDHLGGYWREVARTITSATASGAEWDAHSLEWCVLGSLRLHYTAFTGEVVSKSGAGRYGLGSMPAEFHAVIHHALQVRADGARTSVISAEEMQMVGRLIGTVVDEVLAAAA